jgi:hypothetical protein
MKTDTLPSTRFANILRWIARLWSIPVFGLTLLIAAGQDTTISSPESVPAEDWFLISFWPAAVLGLGLAWRWERAGGIATIILLLLRELAWILIKGGWEVNFLIVWLILAPPALLFLAAGVSAQRRKKE